MTSTTSNPFFLFNIKKSHPWLFFDVLF